MESKYTHHLFGEEIITNTMDLGYKTANTFFSVESLEERSRLFAEIPIEDILAVLEKAGNEFANTNSSIYIESLEKLPKIINYSEQMVEAGLALFASLLTCDFLNKRLSSLGSIHSLDSFKKLKNNTSQRIVPLGSVCHIAAGNIFLGAVDSLIQGIITKNINVLKISSQDPVFPIIFLKALIKVDKKQIIYPYLAVTYWNRENHELDKLIKSNFDALLLFGGEQSVAKYKEGLSPKTELISFGPKISFSLLGRGLPDQDLKKAAKKTAIDIVLWEQKACTSCQNIFIEEDGENIEKFVSYLDDELSLLATEFPQPIIDNDNGIELRKLREEYKFLEFQGNAKIIEGIKSNHTILLNESTNITISPLNRTIFVNRISSYKEIFKGNLGSLKYYMSTMGIMVKESEMTIMEEFIQYGVKRFCKLGIMALGHDEKGSHDGIFLPNSLVRFINKEDISSDKLHFSYLENQKKEQILLSRLNASIQNSLKSPFYKKLYENIDLPLDSLEDLKKLPVLEKEDLVKNSPPKSNSMLTEKNPDSFYYFSAGGTTGTKKYVCYKNEEFSESAIYFGHGFRTAGIEKNDTVANYLKAGALWTGFPAANLGLEETGCKILSLTSNQSLEESLEFIKEFKVNAILAIPGNLIELAHKTRELKLSIEIEKVLYAGEHFSKNGIKLIKDVFQTKEITSFGYAAVETGPIGYQCEFCTGTEHHIFDDYSYLELDKDGEILITTLQRKLHPLIRYKIGDKGEFVNKSCKCGRSSTKIKLLSRTGDMIRLNSVNLYLTEIEETISSFTNLSGGYQVIVDSIGSKYLLEIKIEMIDVVEDSKKANLSDLIKNKLIESSSELKEYMDETNLKELRITLIKTGDIERIKRTGKIKKIIDRRIEELV